MNFPKPAAFSFWSRFPNSGFRAACTLVLVGGTAASLAAASIYVSPQGDDARPGTSLEPVRTLTRARDLLRGDKTEAKEKIVHLLPGVHRLDSTLELNEADSGTEQAPVIFRGIDRNSVFITGGAEVPPTACVPLKNPQVRSRLPEDMQGSVYQVDLRRLGVTDFGEYGPRGFRRPYVPAPLEVFIDEHALHLAQWPNRGEPGIPIGKVLDPGSHPRLEDYSNRGGVFEYNSDRVNRWTQAKKIWITGYFGEGYADDTVQVEKIDFTTKTFTTRQPTMYTFKTGAAYNTWHAINLLEELDRPGEYFADDETGILYFIPPVGVEMSRARVRVSLLKEPLVALEGTRHFRFENVTFENTRGLGVYIERGENVRLQGCTLRFIGIIAVCIGKGTEPLAVYAHAGTAPAASRKLGSWHEHLYDNPTFDREGGVRHGVVNCEIYGIGDGGISLGGGDRKTLTPAGNFIEGCDLHHFNRLSNSACKAGVNVDGVGNIIRKNQIHDAPGSAVYLHGNDHLIEENEITRCVMNVDDMGAVHFGRDPTEQGFVIRRNLFQYNGRKIGGYGTQCIFADDGACGSWIVGNVFYRNVGGQPVKVNTGFDHVVEHNVFIENEGIFCDMGRGGATQWLEGQSSDLYRKRREAVNVFEPPYSTRYPRLIKTLTDPWDAVRTNDFRSNFFVRSGKLGVHGNRNGACLLQENNRYAEELPGELNL